MISSQIIPWKNITEIVIGNSPIDGYVMYVQFNGKTYSIEDFEDLPSALTFAADYIEQKNKRRKNPLALRVTDDVFHALATIVRASEVISKYHLNDLVSVVGL